MATFPKPLPVGPPVLRPCSAALTSQTSIRCGGRLPFLPQTQVPGGTAFYLNPKAPQYQGARDLRAQHTSLWKPTGMGNTINELSPRWMPRWHGEAAFFVPTGPWYPSVPLQRQAVPDLETIPINGCSCPPPAPPPPHRCPVAVVIETGGGGQAREEVRRKILGVSENWWIQEENGGSCKEMEKFGETDPGERMPHVEIHTSLLLLCCQK